jgi:tRNA dimethylallyltransferase
LYQLSQETEPGALLVMGPTASGKSALALAVAEKIGGEIVNADSMQVYRDLRVLTARPTQEDAARAPHHLYGGIDAAERYSVGRWLAEVRAIIDEIRARAAVPIVVGGTGLYFKALTQGLVVAPGAPAEIRKALLSRLEREGPSGLHAELSEYDAEAAARISPRDGPRILRALSVWEMTGRSLRDFPASEPISNWCGIALEPDRKALYRRINTRCEAMVEAGALDEVRALAERGLDLTLPVMKAHGVPAFLAHLRGEIDLARAVELAQRDTRRYAKRQFTWIAHQIPGWRRIEIESLDGRVAAARAELSYKAGR